MFIALNSCLTQLFVVYTGSVNPEFKTQTTLVMEKVTPALGMYVCMYTVCILFTLPLCLLFNV